jgi:hypothetical protein
MTDDLLPHKQDDDDSSKDDMQAQLESFALRYPALYNLIKLGMERGAEPYWMQDIRLAQRRIERQRASGPTAEG